MMNDDVPDLLPCPFCGAEQDDGGKLDDPRYFARCSNGRLAWGCSRCNTVGPDGYGISEAIAAWNTRADLAAPRVRALVWKRMPRGMCHVAETSIGRYAVERNYGGWGLWTPELPVDDCPLEYFKDEEAARAAAQADFTARILAALDMGGSGMSKWSVTVSGRTMRWACDVTEAQAKAMQADGFDVCEIVNSVPSWVANIGLARPWCAVQDVFNWPSTWGKRNE